MQLPESLHPWRQWLEWFAPHYLPLFADLLGRLNPLMGPLRGLQQGGVPEPDGLGDLQRRGAYERLLSSEWLLAEEMPDEFLRRAVVGEHLFLAPQYRARQANRLIVVLFDAGPLQLGAARLVHLALLMLLARRAEEAGAELRWGILQSEPCLFELDSAAQLRQLLNARTWQMVNDTHWQAWRTWLAEQPHTAGECWLVGQRLAKADNQPCTHRVHVQRSLDGKRLAFELQAATTRQVTLPMPDERLAVPLLKGLFKDDVARGVVRGSVPRVSLTLPPVISATGNYIALRLLDEPGMAVIRLPSGERKTSLQVHTPYWSAGRTPLAVTFMSRTVAAVMSDDNHLTFWNVRGLAPVDKPGREELQLPPGTATWLPIAWLHGRQGGRLFLLDTQGHLAYWIARGGKSRVASVEDKTHRLTDKVLGMAKVDAQLVAYVRNEDGRLYAYSIDVDGNQMCGGMIGAAEGVSEVLFAASPAWRKSIGGCAVGAVENGSQRWRLLAAEGSAPQQPEHILLAPGWKALGLLVLQSSQRYALVLLSPDKHSVGLWCEGQQNVLFTTSEPIARVSFCNLSTVVAAITSARELLVYSVHWRRMRLQVMCNQLTEKHTLEHKEDANA